MEADAWLSGSKQEAAPLPPTLSLLRHESVLGVGHGHHFQINTVSSQSTGLVGGIGSREATKGPKCDFLTIVKITVHFGF